MTAASGRRCRRCAGRSQLQSTELARDQLLLVPVGISYRIDGRVRVGRLIIESEIVHEERLARELALSPASGSSEYRIPT